MKISELRKGKLYSSVSEPITELRIENLKSYFSRDDFDQKLYDLEFEIWKRVTAALNIDDE